MDTIYSGLDFALGISATKAEQLSLLQVCLRAFVVYVVLIAYVRLGKKRFLGEATAFDAILIIVNCHRFAREPDDLRDGPIFREPSRNAHSHPDALGYFIPE